MHVHLGEETYSHRGLDESDSLTSSQSQKLLEAGSTHQALTCLCLFENDVDSRTSVPIDPLLSQMKTTVLKRLNLNAS